MSPWHWIGIIGAIGLVWTSDDEDKATIVLVEGIAIGLALLIGGKSAMGDLFQVAGAFTAAIAVIFLALAVMRFIVDHWVVAVISAAIVGVGYLFLGSG
jgi:hypothetical protein